MGKISGLRSNTAAAIGVSAAAGIVSAAGIIYPFHRHRWAPWAWTALSVILGMAYVSILMLSGSGEPPARHHAPGGETSRGH